MQATLKKEPGNALSRELSDEILRAVSGVHYGSVEIVIHQGRVVQIEVREKVRIGSA